TRVASCAFAAPKGSRYFSELDADTELEIYLQLNRWTDEDDPDAPESEYLSGDVYGYLRPRPPSADRTGLRLRHRRVLAHPDLDPDVLGEFIHEPRPLNRLTDIDGTYDLLGEERLVALRYLDFIPFLDRDRQTPDVEHYQVSLQDDGASVRWDLGVF